MQRSSILTAAVTLAAGLFGSAALAVNIDLVTVGDPGNVPDARFVSPGYGSVAYS